MEIIEKDIEDLIKLAKKEGVISTEEIGSKLINYELSSKDMDEVIARLESEGITVEQEEEEMIKDDELKEIISNVKIDDPVKMYLKDTKQ